MSVKYLETNKEPTSTNIQYITLKRISSELFYSSFWQDKQEPISGGLNIMRIIPVCTHTYSGTVYWYKVFIQHGGPDKWETRHIQLTSVATLIFSLLIFFSFVILKCKRYQDIIKKQNPELAWADVQKKSSSPFAWESVYCKQHTHRHLQANLTHYMVLSLRVVCEGPSRATGSRTTDNNTSTI